MYATYLCHALLGHREEYLPLVKIRLAELAWCGSMLHAAGRENYRGGPVLKVITDYVKKYHEVPDHKGVQDYANEIESKGKKSGFRDEVASDLGYMVEHVEEAAGNYATDIHVLIEATIEESRKVWGHAIGSIFAARCMGAAQEEKPSGKPQTVDDAISKLRKSLANDLPKYAPRPEGFLDENMEHVEAEVARWMNSDTSDRVFTGFKHIDNNLIISKLQRRFIGLMGFANDGKTTLLNTLLYNMAARGKNVILFSKEHDPLELWIIFAFLHSHHADYRDKGEILPPMSQFEKREVSDEDRALLQRIVNDIKTRKNISGRIEVRRLTDWEALESHLKQNHAKNRYDVCAVDYLARIDMPWSKPQFRNQDMATQIHMAYDLTRNFDDGKGIVFITPMQINRSGYKAAKQKKTGEKKHDLTSVSQHSAFYEDMDLVFSLWRDPDPKYENDVLLETQKVRGAAKPPDMVMRIDSCSRRVTTKDDAVVDEHWSQFLQGKVDSPTKKWFREHVMHDEEQDGLYSAL